MFRGILPSSTKRIASSSDAILQQFEIIEKENYPPATQRVVAKSSGPHRGGQSLAHQEDADVWLERLTLDRAFNRLLDDLQIPGSLRPKLTGMDPIVKSAMLRSSQHLPAMSTHTPRVLRKTRSSEGLESPRAIKSSTGPLLRSHLSANVFDPPSAPPDVLCAPELPQTHAQNAPLTTSQSFSTVTKKERNVFHVVKEKDGDKEKTTKAMSPEMFCHLLMNTSSTSLEVEAVKKLRLMLRNVATGWTEDFMKCGGYSGLLTRLNELLEIEWREEQHDDMLLHEILKCLKALSTSSIGCFALRSQYPRPFVQLVSLLYSDKKPGDVSSRQIIVELLLVLFDLYNPATSNSAGSLGSSRPSSYQLVRSLLLTRRPPTAEAIIFPEPITPHDFISSIHQPRIYKTYLQELSDICRDYFWIFCHPQNTIWNLDDVDESKVERPKAPGGMTGGVEYEAMGYLTTHLRLLNSLCAAAYAERGPPESELSPLRLHSDLLASGLERILLTARKASTTYYPTLHLEVARYVDHARRAEFDLPWTLSRVLGSPPSVLRKEGHRTPGTPRKQKSSVPLLPSPRRAGPIELL